jgi:hypothetical protein
VLSQRSFPYGNPSFLCWPRVSSVCTGPHLRQVDRPKKIQVF